MTTDTSVAICRPAARTGVFRRVWARCAGLARWLFAQIPAVAMLFCVLVVVLHWTIQDRIFGLDMVYYVGQPIVLTCAAGLAAVMWIWRRRRKRRLALLAATFAAGCAVWTAASAFAWHSPNPPGERTIRVMTWNVARGPFGWQGVADRIRQVGPDVAILTEAWPGAWNHFQKALPEYTASDSSGQLVVLVRGELKPRTWGLLRPGGFYKLVDVRVAGDDLTLVCVDLPSTFLHSREGVMRGLTSLVEALRDRPLLVAGDFNTPPSSMYFGGLRRNFRNAFEAAGAGYAATWPLPIPFLQLDQIWVNSAVDVHSCETRWFPISDHRPVIAEISLR